MRNLPDGTVEAALGETGAVISMVEWAGRGPRSAVVDAIDVYDEELEDLTGFEIRPSVWRA